NPPSDNLEQIARTVRSRGGERLMQVVDDRTGARAFQVMVEMRDGTRLNTFVFLPGCGGPRWPVILHRTPYGITAADARDKTDCTRAWLPSVEGQVRSGLTAGGNRIRTVGPARQAIVNER